METATLQRVGRNQTVSCTPPTGGSVGVTSTPSAPYALSNVWLAAEHGQQAAAMLGLRDGSPDGTRTQVAATYLPVPTPDVELTERTIATVLEVLRYELAQEVGDEAELITVFDRVTANALRGTEGLYRVIDVLGVLRRALLSSVLFANSERRLLTKALRDTHLYLDPRVDLLQKCEPIPERRTGAAEHRHEGWATEVADVALDEVAWPEVADYVDDRLGPLTVLVDVLTDGDEVVFSNGPVQEALPEDTTGGHLKHFELPISSWAKEIDLFTSATGKRTLILSEFTGRSFLRHFQLLVRHRLQARGVAPRVQTIENPAAYETTYNGLPAFFRAHADSLGAIDAVVVGYASAFETIWAQYRRTTVAPAPPHGTNDGWHATVYELPNGRRVAVMQTDDSYHGEILGECLRRLVAEQPTIRSVFAAGSAGSLHVRSPYTMVFPSRVEIGDAQTRPNCLGTDSDALVHTSVTSPLAETRTLLSGAQKRGVTTIDMEMGHVARALADTDVELGVGLLVTDYPAGRPGILEASLADQDPAAKWQAMMSFPAAIETLLTEGHPPASHPLEHHLGRTFDDLSAENIARRLARLGTMTPREQRLFDRVCALGPEYVFRVGQRRMMRIAEDETILSTAQVAQLKHQTVDPTTPRPEEDLYGAWDYTFASVGFGSGDPKYGDVEIRLRPEVWKARSWATHCSGFFSIEQSTGMSEQQVEKLTDASPEMPAAREAFGELVVVPRDYSTWLATQVVQATRDMDPERAADIFAADDAALAALLGEQRLGYLEGKIRGSLNIVDIESVTLPADAPRELAQRLRALGVAVIQPRVEPEH